MNVDDRLDVIERLLVTQAELLRKQAELLKALFMAIESAAREVTKHGRD